jgi:hypothetical protein
LIAAPSDQASFIPWYKYIYTITGATGDGVGAGKKNTYMIIGKLGSGSYAAKLCTDLTLGGYTDWYLPSKYELNLMYTYKNVIGNFAPSEYWSSTESGGDAWLQEFLLGLSYPDAKDQWFHVRAIRAF